MLRKYTIELLAQPCTKFRLAEYWCPAMQRSDW